MGMLDGKIAIVTGAGRGIGRGEALLLAAEGAKVIVNDVGAAVTGEGGDRSPAQQTVDDIVAAGGEAAINADDVSSWAGAEQLVNQAVETWGQLDILVNNAGILRDKMSFNMEESDWDDVIRVHLKGHFATSHFAAVHWRNRSKAGETLSGRIINTASESGLFGNAGQANYGAAKAGIATLTIILARELKNYGADPDDRGPVREHGGVRRRQVRRVRSRERRTAGRLPRIPGGCRHKWPELHRLRRIGLGDAGMDRCRTRQPRHALDSRGTRRREGRAVCAALAGDPAVRPRGVAPAGRE
jgi:NAD(P)-dependent dehydrogenase (short-subunit alcohol dehydrogenase family)